MKIKKFEVEDMREGIEWTVPITTEIINRVNQLSAITVTTNEDEMVCVIGGDVIAPEVAIVLMMCSTRLSNHRISTIKEIRQALEFYISYHQLRKLYTTAVAKTQRWVEWMGFDLEYVMKDVYGEGQHLYGYAMIVSKEGE